MAYLIKAGSNEFKVFNPGNGKNFTLKELQTAVGGYIEIIHPHSVFDGMLLIINEEGKINDLEINPAATILYQYGAHDPVCGDVILCHTSEVD